MKPMPMRQLNLLVLCLLGTSLSYAQLGCTDPQAINYNPNATTNNGSCVYGFTSYSPEWLTDLTGAFDESSGLLYHEGQLYTQLDEGAPRIFGVDVANGEEASRHLLLGASNIDWEDMAENEEYFYVGDFGNNDGDRMDLKILRMAKSDLGNNIINAETIEFSYQDQTEFDFPTNQHNYDCEAFIYYDDALHLFSKNWLDGKTRHYRLRPEPGTWVAEIVESFDVGGLITAADVNEEGVITLIGRNVDEDVFMWLFFDYPPNQYFSGNARRIDLGNDDIFGQPEGLTFTQGGEGYISTETSNNVQARLYRFNISQWTEMLTGTSALPTEGLHWNNPFSNHIQLDFDAPSTSAQTLYLWNANGVLVAGPRFVPVGTQSHRWPINTAASGAFYLQIKSLDGQIAVPLLRMD